MAQAAAHVARPERVAAVRAAVLAAARDGAAALGRAPRATEVLRWRAEATPGIPSQAALYRAFPRG